MGVSADAPWTDCAYKLVEYDGRAVLKLSTDKQTLPGAKQMYRHRDKDGIYLKDTIALATEEPPDNEAEPLLGEVMRNGKLLESLPRLEERRVRFKREFACLPDLHTALRSPQLYDVSISDELERLRSRMVRGLEKHPAAPRHVEGP